MSKYDFESKNREIGDIEVGYDIGFQGYFLVINPVNPTLDEDGNDKYIFHNMQHWDNLKMTIDDIEMVLAKAGDKLPTDIKAQLILDAA